MRIIAAAGDLQEPGCMKELGQDTAGGTLYLQSGPWQPLQPEWCMAAPGSILNLEGHRILVAPARPGLMDMARQAAALHCDVLLRTGGYVAWCLELEGVLVVDPGNIRHSANCMPPSFACLELDAGRQPACTIQWLKGIPHGEKSRFQSVQGYRRKGQPDS
ncbi:hypothetical protein [Faecalibaculum rodentium]|uniref:hypothetical protein n=1 Tax=Faecalibaculum rodentium TaxID=1702221 RepID=UPI0025791754|nr:hypothetical protein [Faecalibaculum rodentium]